jgi:malate dehydrogenase (oxaloacetate-decarboxylating)
VVRTRLHGIELLSNSRLNKGTAFTEEERTPLACMGCCRPTSERLDDQREAPQESSGRPGYALPQVQQHARPVQDNCETLFYSLIAHHTEELLPIVYTPAVGEGCQRFSEIWRRPRGLFVSYPTRIASRRSSPTRALTMCAALWSRTASAFSAWAIRARAAWAFPSARWRSTPRWAAFPPEHCLPILLDVGTDNEARLNDPIYIGWQHKRVRGPEYDEFIEEFVTAVERRWPHILLQWEDFAGVNAAILLKRYRDRLCTFNDDIQGTAAVTTGTLLAAVRATGRPLKEQTIAMFGSGSAGIGIGDLLIARMKEEGLTEEQARKRIYCFNRYGLLVEGCEGIRPGQEPLMRKRGRRWMEAGATGAISLLDVGAQRQGHRAGGRLRADRRIYRGDCARDGQPHRAPIIFPLSNPTSKSEAKPADLLRWTDGRALVGTGSPFDPVEVNGKLVRISQVNNSFIFPGLALGILVSRSTRVSDAMIMASAKALAGLSPALEDPNAPLLPPIADCRKVSLVIAEAVAKQAMADGTAEMAGFARGAWRTV